MDAQEFARRVGDHLIHVTLAENIPSIEENGLIRPVKMAAICSVPTKSLLLRTEALKLRSAGISARLNSQAWLVAGRNQASNFLDGHSLETWSAQLDDRLFFWPKQKGEAFARSLSNRGDHVALQLDSRLFYDAFSAQIDLAPINTGSAMRRAARRGDWIYVPAQASWDTFADNRIKRGLTKTRDSVTEVSLKTDIPRDILASLRL